MCVYLKTKLGFLFYFNAMWLEFLMSLVDQGKEFPLCLSKGNMINIWQRIFCKATEKEDGVGSNELFG